MPERGFYPARRASGEVSHLRSEGDPRDHALLAPVSRKLREIADELDGKANPKAAEILLKEAIAMYNRTLQANPELDNNERREIKKSLDHELRELRKVRDIYAHEKPARGQSPGAIPD